MLISSLRCCGRPYAWRRPRAARQTVNTLMVSPRTVRKPAMRAGHPARHRHHVAVRSSCGHPRLTPSRWRRRRRGRGRTVLPSVTLRHPGIGLSCVVVMLCAPSISGVPQAVRTPSLGPCLHPCKRGEPQGRRSGRRTSSRSAIQSAGTLAGSPGAPIMSRARSSMVSPWITVSADFFIPFSSGFGIAGVMVEWVPLRTISGSLVRST